MSSNRSEAQNTSFVHEGDIGPGRSTLKELRLNTMLSGAGVWLLAYTKGTLERVWLQVQVQNTGSLDNGTAAGPRSRPGMGSKPDWFQIPLVGAHPDDPFAIELKASGMYAIPYEVRGCDMVRLCVEVEFPGQREATPDRTAARAAYKGMLGVWHSYQKGGA